MDNIKTNLIMGRLVLGRGPVMSSCKHGSDLQGATETEICGAKRLYPSEERLCSMRVPCNTSIETRAVHHEH